MLLAVSNFFVLALLHPTKTHSHNILFVFSLFFFSLFPFVAYCLLEAINHKVMRQCNK